MKGCFCLIYSPNWYLYICFEPCRAVENVLQSKHITGTAVTTMKACNAVTLPPPNVTNTTATAPIRTAKNARNHLGGFPSPEIAIEIVSDIESVVVNTKTVVTIKNSTPKTALSGKFSVIAIIAAGGPAASNASETDPGTLIS